MGWLNGLCPALNVFICLILFQSGHVCLMSLPDNFQVTVFVDVSILLFSIEDCLMDFTVIGMDTFRNALVNVWDNSG